MASLKHIRKRIASVKNTQKVTKAMKLVAAAKLRRAQRLAHASRQYTDECLELIRRIESRSYEYRPPLFTLRPVQRVDLVMLFSDRGLCGGFNENLLRECFEYRERQHTAGKEVSLLVLGRKGREGVKRKAVTERVIEFSDLLPENHPQALAQKLSQVMMDRFLHQQSDQVVVAYNRFFSAGTQRVVFEPLLPFGGEEKKVSGVEYLSEPPLPQLLTRLTEATLLQCTTQMLLDSRASELAARMKAMDNATKNAAEMIDVLTLQYNRARQAAITSDLIDIIGGAEALT